MPKFSKNKLKTILSTIPTLYGAFLDDNDMEEGVAGEICRMLLESGEYPKDEEALDLMYARLIEVDPDYIDPDSAKVVADFTGIPPDFKYLEKHFDVLFLSNDYIFRAVNEPFASYDYNQIEGFFILYGMDGIGKYLDTLKQRLRNLEENSNEYEKIATVIEYLNNFIKRQNQLIRQED